MARKAKIAIKTKETDIKIELTIDGRGVNVITTPNPFFSHMLSNFSKHGLFDLKLSAKGDVDVDYHHTIEDVGLRLGSAFKKALGSASGIRRCAGASMPMMDSLATVTVDVSNRPYFRFNTTKESDGLNKKSVFSDRKARVFDMGLLKEFLKAFSNAAGVDLHVSILYGDDIHHAIEAVFKSLGRALSSAVEKDARIKGALSTKGRL
ncbi:MAG: imidazoleglycerol-phosphate dehydratase [Deltaproteobacteria bacterium]|nr:imidazoleglycerol-phosphate dehydratase [Deltaproteobacteria bacterium]